MDQLQKSLTQSLDGLEQLQKTLALSALSHTETVRCDHNSTTITTTTTTAASEEDEEASGPHEKSEQQLSSSYTAAVDLSEIHPTFTALVKLISHQATLLAVSWKGSDIKEATSACMALSTSTSQLVLAVESTPMHVGRLVKRHVVLATMSLLHAVVSLLSMDPFAREVQNQPGKHQSQEAAWKAINSSAGQVWASCTEMEHLPLTNAALAVTRLQLCDSQLEDAVMECQDRLDGKDSIMCDLSDMDDDEWDECTATTTESKSRGVDPYTGSEEDRTWITTIQSMIKTCRLSIKLIVTELSKCTPQSSKGNHAIDLIIKLADNYVECADNIVSDIDGPLDDTHGQIRTSVDALGNAQKQFLGAIETLFTLQPPLPSPQEDACSQIWLNLYLDKTILLIEKLQIKS
ncbi:hypothetical protein BASA50_001060 [Batrachochytrium salamandrivorans]|uniref:Cyclin-D1-binding protein 1-like N-terminal domain-containing protein n=1 Tax=Batrachochytrium salamandrivorans TaxID=1357716 RepID=A0ABQ8EST3_9FUNG|nr:hypothetical protein BASA60_004515 [Batrachochytrium salamandrivorans]KAH6585725.1 hypothetical protein BASA50_001060 [Batrachochytrium salamandrivorans]KAH6588211.1 hypothetical protein BASA61_006020 [Batrachochytrium salamandrivorans]KAH9273937.1 hypothetical protein BASA83_003569 [Batrachochytrium salamandrivorans]